MAKVDMAIIVSVEASSYDDALNEADNIADGLGQEGVNASAVLDYEHDNDHQRVLYLHPIVLGYGQSDDFPSVAAGEPVYLDETVS